MNRWFALQVVLALLEGIVKHTPNKTDDLLVNGAQAALKELNAVRGTEVFKAQLESLRVEPQW